MYLESLLNRSFLLLFTLPQESSILYGKFYRKEGIRFMKISLFPTLKNYKKEYFGKDLTAGIMIAAVSIPISMGYAEVSGLPAVLDCMALYFLFYFLHFFPLLLSLFLEWMRHRRPSQEQRLQVLELRVGVWMHSGIFQLLHYSLVYGCFYFIF